MGKKKVKYSSFDRGFRGPFIEPDYYKKYSWRDVLNEVRKDFERNFYTVTFPAKGFSLTKDTDHIDYKEMATRKAFEIANNPDIDIMEAIGELLFKKDALNAKQIYELVKNEFRELDIKGKGQILKLLKKGEGNYWKVVTRGRAKLYSLIVQPICAKPLQKFDNSIKSNIPEGIQTDSPSNELIKNELIKFEVHHCPDLFESNNPDSRKIVAHFGKIINTWLHASTSTDRRKAKDTIDDILERPCHIKWSKVYNQPLLSLNKMFAYLHKITEYLKELYIKSFGYEPINYMDKQTVAELRSIDERLVEIAQNRNFEMFLSKPKRFTTALMADFLNLKEGTLKQYLKEEKKHPNCHTPQKR